MSQNLGTTPGEWTYSEYARLPDDGNRYEVLDGEVLVTPAPSPHHQKVIGRLLLLLIEYVEATGLGWVFQRRVDLGCRNGHRRAAPGNGARALDAAGRRGAVRAGRRTCGRTALSEDWTVHRRP